MSTTMEQYLQAWTRLARLADAVPEPAWDAPSPCADWTARQLAGHLVDGARQVQALLRRRPPLVPVTDPTALAGLAGDNPRAALRDAAGTVKETVADLDPDHPISTPHGPLPAEQVLAMALIEPVVHAWDLARATKQPVVLDDEAVATLLVGVEQVGDQLAATGMYANALRVPDHAPPTERLLAALGRHDPRR